MWILFHIGKINYCMYNFNKIQNQKLLQAFTFFLLEFANKRSPQLCAK